MDSLELVDYIMSDDYPDKRENANRLAGTFGWMKNTIAEEIIKEYTLKKVLPKEIARAHIEGYIHIHDLGCGFFVKYCSGWDLLQILIEGFNGVPNVVESKPPKHLSSALGQILNFLGVLQQEAAGAQALNSFDVLLSPYVYYDRLSYKEVKQYIQEFIFNLNVTVRWGHETLFSNISFDIVPPDDLRGMPVVIGGQTMDRTYEEFQEQMDMINKAFLEVLYEGDGNGTSFSFPIPTYFITKDFPWDSDVGELLCKVAAKWGSPYFQNCISSGLKPSDVRAMCCRLLLDNNEIKEHLMKNGLLRNVTGGLFGSGNQTGSIGVCTLNLSKLGYLAKNEDEFFDLLDKYLEIAKDALEIKRRLVEYFTYKVNPSLCPYTKRYLKSYDTFFNTIGVIAGHECCMNLLGVGIQTKDGQKFMIKTLKHIRERIREFQEETGHLYNLEATPGEGCSYRLARIDKKMHPDIYTSGSGNEVYYTNSTQLPVGYTDNLGFILEHQEPLQTLYTGGTIVHVYIGELIEPKAAGDLIDHICRNYKIPYLTLTPTYSKCPNCGYIPGEYWICPNCKSKCYVFSRIVGYYRPVDNWNPGKKREFMERKYISLSKSRISST